MPGIGRCFCAGRIDTAGFAARIGAFQASLALPEQCLGGDDREPDAMNRLIRCFSRLLALCAWLLAGQALADAGNAVVTITEGPAQILRGVNRSPAAVGVRMRAGDILMVDAAGFLRIETDDGLRVDLGPGARALWLPKPSPNAAQRLLYLQSGLIKVSSPIPRGATPSAFSTPMVDVDQATVVVLAQEAEKLWVFAETGGVNGHERAAAPGGEASLSLKPGECLSRAGDKKTAPSPRPPPEFISRLPRPFLDTLPARYAELAKRDTVLKPGPAVAYEDIQGWLQAEPALRRDLMSRWRPRARDAAFKAALVANMNRHPEWERVLFPERFRPQSAAGQQPVSPARSSQ